MERTVLRLVEAVRGCQARLERISLAPGDPASTADYIDLQISVEQVRRVAGGPGRNHPESSSTQGPQVCGYWCPETSSLRSLSRRALGQNGVHSSSPKTNSFVS